MLFASSFETEIEKNRHELEVPRDEVVLSGLHSSLDLRLRGGFITGCELTSPSTSDRIQVLYSEQDTSIAKLPASHIMSPVGPSEGLGGQHGFPRWADYKEFPLDGGPEGQKRVSLQAKRSDDGPAINKLFELSDSKLAMATVLGVPGAEVQQTSLGEHLYFTLDDENMDGLRLGNWSFDDRFGAGTEASIMVGEPLYWDYFDAHATNDIIIRFPAGHSIRLSAEVNIPTQPNKNEARIGMLIWHKPGSDSICFEPTLGFHDGKGDGLVIPPEHEATLQTTIELL
ncbi:hypothetical protein HY003_03705 [Candidatus Saccharibacteria bacterium]|nr:hypothetical protein [Candidatus Saccharibacteria bacterium]